MHEVQKTVSTRKVWLPKHGHYVHFTHRDTMRRKHPMAKAVLPTAEHVAPVTTTLPVDCTGNGAVSCPMDANDSLGICGPAMCDHVDGIRTFGQGKPGFSETHADVSKLTAQYETVSGGDNGTNEDMLVGPSGIWITGIAEDTSCVVADHLDVEVTNVALAQYCIDQFYAVCMAWSVPDAFLQGFAAGSSWLQPMIPDDANGHYSPLTDVDASGNMRLFTWGAWAWVSPAMIATVEPECFVTFSALQFNKATGLDSHGRHVVDQAAKWVAMGGDAAKVGTVVALFPAKAAA
jgi:hypothetical protein